MPDWGRHGIRLVRSGELDSNTPQTRGMTRAEAISHARVGAQRLWAGTVVVHPNAKTGPHHHGDWQWTELRGAGDLRPYILVQLYPFVALLFLMALFPPRYSGSVYLVVAIGLYGLAKVFEQFDRQVFAATRDVSGHTMKHLTAGVGTYLILEMLKRRRPRPRN